MSTDQMPDGWTRVQFGEVVRNVNENSRDLDADGIDRVIGLDHLDPGSLRLERWDSLENLPDGTTFTRRFKSGQVLFGKRRAYQRKVAVPDFEGVCSGDILVFEPADERMLAEFLPYLVQSDGFFDHALGTSAGSLSPRTKWAELAKYEFALPPLDEQRRIVEVQVSCDKMIESRVLAVTAIDNWSKSFVKDATSAASLIRLGDVANLTIGKTPPRADSSYWDSDSGLPFCSIADIKSRVVTSTRESVSERAVLDGKAKKFPAGSLMMSFKLTIGRLAFAGVDLWPNEAIVRIDPHGDQNLKEYLYWALQTVDLLQDSDRAVKGSTLNLKKLNNLQIPLIPRAEMDKMLFVLKDATRVRDSLVEAIRTAKALSMALLAETIGPRNVH